jgi:glycosyltransferase involved in cell wall biosynthesis
MLVQMEKAEHVLASEADVCFASASELYKKLKAMNTRTYILPNALNPEHFLANSAFVPADLAALPKPLVGFVGSLYDHIDFRVFEKIAEILKEGTVVLVGFTNRKDDLRRMLARHKNMYYAGAKSFDEVPAYMKAFDVCLSPFNIDAIGNSVNPLKMYEYSIFGKPIISARTKEMENFTDLVYLYSMYEEIEQALKQALNEHTNDARKQRRIQFAQHNSWQARVDQIEQVLGL